MNTKLKKTEKWLSERLSQADEEFSFCENYGKCEKKKLYSARTKLSYYNVFHRTFIPYTNEKILNTYK